MSDSQQADVDVKVYTLNKVFNAKNIKERVEGYVNRVYCNSNENRKIRKAFRNQLLQTIKEENEVIKNSLRIIEKKRLIKKRKKREYKATPYVEFCREMKKLHGPGVLSGQIQKLWREKNNKSPKQPKEVVVEVAGEKTEEQKQKEYNNYIEEYKLINSDYKFETDSDSDDE